MSKFIVKKKFEYAKLGFTFTCYENHEEVSLTKVGAFSGNTLLFDSKPLGTAFCSLLNSKNGIIQFKHQIEIDIKQYIKDTTVDSVIDNIRLIFTEFTKINEYLKLTENSFTDCAENILRKLYHDKNKNVLEIYKNCLCSTIDGITDSICHGNSLIRYGKHSIFLPSVYTTFKTKSKKDVSLIHKYKIENINQLINISYYQLMLNRYHIKQCIYPNCNKYFTSLRGQTKYCENPCPADPSQTCRSIRKLSILSDNAEPWQEELSNLEKQWTRIRTRFYDTCKRSNIPKSKKVMINNNHEKFKEITNILRKYIKGASTSKRDFYLTIYKNFLNEVEANLNLSPPVFKIKKPKL